MNEVKSELCARCSKVTTEWIKVMIAVNPIWNDKFICEECHPKILNEMRKS